MIIFGYVIFTTKFGTQLNKDVPFVYKHLGFKERRGCKYYFKLTHLIQLLCLSVQGLPERDKPRVQVYAESVPVSCVILLESVAHRSIWPHVSINSLHCYHRTAYCGILQQNSSILLIYSQFCFPITHQNHKKYCSCCL